MDWNNSSSTSIILRSPTAFVSQPSAEISTNLFYNSNQFDRFSGLEIIKHHGPGPVEMMESSIIAPNNMERDIMIMSYGNHQDKIKRRLTANQLELLESSFQQERKLEPDRKMKLARDLGLQPRQVAVWFQNRRARWKAKKLEHLYDALKIEFELVSKEKLKLQEEVLRLKGMLVEQGTTRKQVCNSYKEASCEETVESTSAAVNQSSLSDHQNKPNNTTSQPIYNNRHFLFEVDDYNAVSPSYWAALP